MCSLSLSNICCIYIETMIQNNVPAVSTAACTRIEFFRNNEWKDDSDENKKTNGTMRIAMMWVVSRALIEKESDRKWNREKWQRGSKTRTKDREHKQTSKSQFIRECSLINWSTVWMIFIFIWLIHVDSSYNFCVWCKECVCARTRFNQLPRAWQKHWC